MKDLLDLLNSKNYSALIIISLTLIFIWLFKDMKKSLLETKKSDLNFIDQSLESYAQSLKALYSFLNNYICENALLDILYSSYKYFDKHIIDDIDMFTSSRNIITYEQKLNLLINLSKKFKDKIDILKEKQLHQTITKNHKLFIFDFVDLISKNNLDVYYNAFLHSSVILSISSISLVLITLIYTFDTKLSIILTIFMITFIFWLFLLPISIELLLKKYYKKTFLFILLFLSPFASIYFIYTCPNYIGKILILITFIISLIINFYLNVKYAKLLNKK